MFASPILQKGWNLTNYVVEDKQLWNLTPYKISHTLSKKRSTSTKLLYTYRIFISKMYVSQPFSRIYYQHVLSLKFLFTLNITVVSGIIILVAKLLYNSVIGVGLSLHIVINLGILKLSYRFQTGMIPVWLLQKSPYVHIKLFWRQYFIWS